jgi:photosystem II stability/assembly factor-like uncharacterized protein
MKYFVTLLLATLLTSASSAQWTRTNGPESGAGYGVFEHNSKLFACTFDGLYVSTDNAASWKPAGLQGKDIYQYLESPLGILVSVNDTLFSTHDEGQTWQQLKAFGGDFISDIVHKATILYVTVSGFDTATTGMYRSTDDGETWTKTTSPSTSSYIRTLSSAGPYLIAATNSEGIYRTTDAGDTWIKLSNGLDSDPHVYSMLVYNQYIYVAGIMGFFYSTNNGDSWIIPKNNGLDSLGFAIYTFERLGKRIFASMYLVNEGCMFSDDNGENWYPITAGQYLPSSETAYAFSVIGQNCYQQIGNGIFRTSDGGVTWSEHNKGIPALISDVGFSDGDTLVAWGPTGLFKTGDAGNTWIHYRGIDNAWIKATGTINFNGSNYLYGDRFWLYSNGGVIGFGQGAYDVVHLDTGLVSLTSYGLIYSTGQINWSNPLPPPIPDSLGSMQKLVSSGTSLIVQCFNPTYDTATWYRSIDGNNWQKVHQGDRSSQILSSAMHKGVFYIGTYYGGLMRSEDDGLTWAQDNAVDPTAYVDILYSTGQHLFCQVDFDGITTTNGLNIRKENSDGFRFVGQGLPYATSLYLHTDGYLYAGSVGIWKRPMSELGISEPVITTSIQTLRPNPATDYIIVDEDATVTLFSSTGAEVFTTKAMQDERIALPKLAAGVYIAKIETKSGVKSAKVVVQ